MNIRRIEKRDLPVVLVLEKLLYKDPWNEKKFESEIEQNDYAYMYVLEHEGVVLGYAGFWLSYEYATITKVSINPAVQRKGYYSDGEDAIVMLLEKGDEHYEQVYIGNRE